MLVGQRTIIFDEVKNGLIPTVSDSTQSKRIPLLLLFDIFRCSPYYIQRHELTFFVRQ